MNYFVSTIKRTPVLLLILLFSCSAANAASIQRIGFTEMVQASELVFEGEVIASDASWNANKTGINTMVTFLVRDVIKGDFAEAQIKLRFGGGAIGEVRQEYQGLLYPKVGEKGIYFVETTQRYLINPLIGWNQGHFKQVDGSMTNSQKQPILSVSTQYKKVVGQMSEGDVGGLTIGKMGATGMSVADFKARIKNEMVDQSTHSSP